MGTENPDLPTKEELDKIWIAPVAMLYDSMTSTPNELPPQIPCARQRALLVLKAAPAHEKLVQASNAGVEVPVRVI